MNFMFEFIFLTRIKRYDKFIKKNFDFTIMQKSFLTLPEQAIYENNKIIYHHFFYFNKHFEFLTP